MEKHTRGAKKNRSAPGLRWTVREWQRLRLEPTKVNMDSETWRKYNLNLNLNFVRWPQDTVSWTKRKLCLGKCGNFFWTLENNIFRGYKCPVPNSYSRFLRCSIGAHSTKHACYAHNANLWNIFLSLGVHLPKLYGGVEKRRGAPPALAVSTWQPLRCSGILLICTFH